MPPIPCFQRTAADGGSTIVTDLKETEHGDECEAPLYKA